MTGQTQQRLDQRIAQYLAILVRCIPGLRALPWRYRITGVVDAADEIPRVLLPRTAVLAGGLANAKWVAFDCPRHATERILLNLSTGRRPRWKTDSTDVLGVRPSVDAVHGGTRCHFWIRHGKVSWVEDRAASSSSNVMREEDRERR